MISKFSTKQNQTPTVLSAFIYAFVVIFYVFCEMWGFSFFCHALRWENVCLVTLFGCQWWTFAFKTRVKFWKCYFLIYTESIFQSMFEFGFIILCLFHIEMHPRRLCLWPRLSGCERIHSIGKEANWTTHMICIYGNFL